MWTRAEGLFGLPPIPLNPVCYRSPWRLTMAISGFALSKSASVLILISKSPVP